MDIHLAAGVQVERDDAALALVVEGDDLTVDVVVVLAGNLADLLAAGIGDGDVFGSAVAAEGHRDGGLRAYEQVDLVARLEGPAVLGVVPVEAFAGGSECLVIGSVEELVGQVEVIFVRLAGRLYLRGHGVEVDVAGDDGLGGVLLAAGSLEEPAAHLRALLGGGGGIVDVEGTNLLVLFTDELAEHGALVGVDIGQLEVGLLDNVEHILNRGLTICHGDGHLTLGLIALVGDSAYLTLLGSGRDGVLVADHGDLL